MAALQRPGGLGQITHPRNTLLNRSPNEHQNAPAIALRGVRLRAVLADQFVDKILPVRCEQRSTTKRRGKTHTNPWKYKIMSFSLTTTKIDNNKVNNECPQRHSVAKLITTWKVTSKCQQKVLDSPFFSKCGGDSDSIQFFAIAAIVLSYYHSSIASKWALCKLFYNLLGKFYVPFKVENHDHHCKSSNKQLALAHIIIWDLRLEDSSTTQLIRQRKRNLFMCAALLADRSVLPPLTSPLWKNIRALCSTVALHTRGAAPRLQTPTSCRCGRLPALCFPWLWCFSRHSTVSITHAGRILASWH